MAQVILGLFALGMWAVVGAILSTMLLAMFFTP